MSCDIYPYFFYYVWFCLFCAFLQNSSLQVQNMWLEDIFEAMWIKADTKKLPKMTQHRQSTRTRTTSKRSVREAGEAPRPMVVVAWPCCLEHTAVRPPCPQFVFFLCGFSASCAILSVLTAVLSLKEHVSRPIQGIIHHTILILLVLY